MVFDTDGLALMRHSSQDRTLGSATLSAYPCDSGSGQRLTVERTQQHCDFVFEGEFGRRPVRRRERTVLLSDPGFLDGTGNYLLIECATSGSAFPLLAGPDVCRVRSPQETSAACRLVQRLRDRELSSSRLQVVWRPVVLCETALSGQRRVRIRADPDT